MEVDIVFIGKMDRKTIEKQRCEGKELDNLFDLNYMVFILLPKCLEC